MAKVLDNSHYEYRVFDSSDKFREWQKKTADSIFIYKVTPIKTESITKRYSLPHPEDHTTNTFGVFVLYIRR